MPGIAKFFRLLPAAALVFLCGCPGSRAGNSSHPGVHTVASDLPSPAEIAKLPPDGGPEFNRLIFESSPYLLQHARNPVDWWPWSDEALKAAKDQNKPIFLSVGYSTCHWCHVMERECFEQKDVADILNAHYIAIKVDREERPDLDAIYITATQMINHSAGWPNNLWLTPEGKPFFAGTYVPRGQFKQLLLQLSSAYTDRRAEVDAVAQQLAEAIAVNHDVEKHAAEFTPSLQPLSGALKQAQQMYDPVYGGLGGAPKFPPHGMLQLLAFELYRDGSQEGYRKMLLHTLDRMADGGIHDQLDGGFHRYSTDAKWLLPHFEKMLYDNAQLGRAYVDAYKLTGDEKYKRVADDVYSWVLREMTDPQGGFYSAIDADSEGVEGKFYIWKLDEIRQALGEQDAAVFAKVYGVAAEGNFADEASGAKNGENVLYLPKPLEQVAAELKLQPDELRLRLEEMGNKLLLIRNKRVHPHTDDKVLASWNGLMIGSLAYAGKQLDEPQYIAAAARAANFLGSIAPKADGQRAHMWRAGKPRGGAYLDDYANVIDGMIELHVATGEYQWLMVAQELAGEMNSIFRDSDGSYFYSAASQSDAIVRRKDSTDDVTPSGNGMASRVLARLAMLTGDKQYAQQARSLLSAFGGTLKRAPLNAESFALASALLSEHATAIAPGLGKEHAVVSHQGPVSVWIIAAPVYERGKPGTLEVHVKVDPNYHVNAISSASTSAQTGGSTVGTTLEVKGAPLQQLKVDYPQPREVTLGGTKTRVYSDAFVIKVAFTVPASVAPGDLPLHLDLTTQPCDEHACQLPQVHKLDLTLKVK